MLEVIFWRKKPLWRTPSMSSCQGSFFLLQIVWSSGSCRSVAHLLCEFWWKKTKWCNLLKVFLFYFSAAHMDIICQHFLIGVVSQCIPVVELEWLDPCKIHAESTQDLAHYICNRHPVIPLKLQEPVILYSRHFVFISCVWCSLTWKRCFDDSGSSQR